jgi:hypothetical protein
MRIRTERKQAAASKNLSNDIIGGQRGRLNGTAAILATLAIILAMAGLSSCGSTASASHPESTATTPAQQTTTPASGTLSPNATSIAFGNVAIGSTSAQTVTLTNSGGATVDISQVAISGTGLTIVAGNASGASLAVGASLTVQIQFAPQAAGAVTGSLLITNDGTSPSLAISLTGTGTQTPQAQITATPSTVAFGSVVDGTTNSQTISIKNTGNADLTLSQDSVTGTGFTISGLSLQTIPAGSSVTFNAVFSPTTAGAGSGSISIVSNAGNSPFAISLSGTGTASVASLSASPASVNFGNIAPGNTSSQNVTLTNTGNANVTISGINVTGAGLSDSGVSPNMTLQPNQSLTLTATFSPTSAGSTSGNITISSNAASSIVISLSGTSHTVNLAWSPSSSTDVVAYNVYRGITVGQYTRLTSSPIAATQFMDGTVQDSQTYYYAVTSIDSSNVESADSTDAVVLVP